MNKILVLKLASIFLMSYLFLSCNSSTDSQKTENEKKEDSTKTEATNSIDPQKFQKKIEGKEVKLFTLKNKNGLALTVTNYGGTWVSLIVPDKNGKMKDVILGFDNIDDLMTKNAAYIGSTVGRYANRLALAKFQLDGKTYQLATNDGKNQLHGGLKGFDKVIWDVAEQAENKIALTYLSKDGEENYPGNFKVNVTFTLTDENAVNIDYEATTDKKTVCNLTNHAYFNLEGADKVSPIKNHFIQIFADKYTPVDGTLIPTGKLETVENTPFDFRKAKMIGKEIDVQHPQIVLGKGYDHNFVINPDEKNTLKKTALVYSIDSGIQMEVLTTEPGVQFYTGNFLNGSIKGKGNVAYQYRTGFCLETQHFPDSPNQPSFPTTVLEPNQVFKSQTVYKFGIVSQ